MVIDRNQLHNQPRILCISNGHGEDQIASRIVTECLTLGIEVLALPIVGEGNAYKALEIPLLDATKVMPSGGFIYQDWRQFWRDLQDGLLGLTWRQIQLIRQQQSQVDLVLAVGDIVVLLMAWLSGSNYAFMGTAKSDYYWRNEVGPYRKTWIPQRSDYLPWERWLMSRPRCQGVFPRDQLTAKNLQILGLPIFDLGNPMMDGLKFQDQRQDQRISLENQVDPLKPTVLLLPGSRPPEAYQNWQLMIRAIQDLPPEIAIYAAITSNLSTNLLREALPEKQKDIPLIRADQFAACIQRADVVFAMAGTAIEQCVGLGKPVVTISGEGPQFTYRFAEAQTRLLGSSIYLSTPETASKTIQQLLQKLKVDPNFREHLQHHGLQRMGSPGAARRIATQIQQWLRNDRASFG